MRSLPAVIALIAMGTCLPSASAVSRENGAAPGSAGSAYPNMPEIAPIGVRIGKYMNVPASAEGPAIDPAKGYRLQDLGDGLYMVTDNVYQSMLLVYDKGIVVVDAPQTYAVKIPQAIAELGNKPITHVIYSHAHKDHIGGTKGLGGTPVIIAHKDTLDLLKRDNDPDRPLPTVTFSNKYTLRVGGKLLELEDSGTGHEPGNLFILAPKQRVLMIVDVVFPGWMPWRRFAVARDVLGSIEQTQRIGKMRNWDVLVGGHVSRTGTHADVDTQNAFYADLKAAAADALATTKPGDTLDPADKGNPWALFDNYIDRVAAKCVNTITPKWSSRLGGYDAWVWDQCFSMEQTLRIE